MGDLPKPSDDDAVWTELERSFFAGAPPEATEPPGEPPRLDEVCPTLPPQRPWREIFVRVRTAMAAAWRRTTLVVDTASAYTMRNVRAGAAGLIAASAQALRKTRASAAGLIAALSIGRIDRRLVVFTMVGTILVAGLSSGVIASRDGALAKAARAQPEGPVSTPTVAQTERVAVSTSRAAPQPKVRSSAEVRSGRAEASNRRLRVHRKPAPAASSAKRPLLTAFEDRETYWARAGQSAPLPASRPLFSR